MSNTPQVDLAALHSAMVANLQAAFPDVTVAAYSRPGERINTPAILVELDSITATSPIDVGTQQVKASLLFNAYCVVSYKGAGKFAVRTLAASLLAHVRGQRFGQPIGAAEPIGADPDMLEGVAGVEYEVFRVSWNHEPAYLGTSVWDSTGVIPTELNITTNIELGLGNAQ